MLGPFNVAGATHLGATILRIHSQFEIAFNTADTAPSAFIGMIVQDNVNWTGQADEFEEHWLLNQYYAPGTARTALTQGTSMLCGDHFDVRAKRHLPMMNDSLLFSIKNTGSASITYTLFSRVLLALH
jgi:hypothetical protein